MAEIWPQMHVSMKFLSSSSCASRSSARISLIVEQNSTTRLDLSLFMKAFVWLISMTNIYKLFQHQLTYFMTIFSIWFIQGMQQLGESLKATARDHFEEEALGLDESDEEDQSYTMCDLQTHRTLDQLFANGTEVLCWFTCSVLDVQVDSITDRPFPGRPYIC